MVYNVVAVVCSILIPMIIIREPIEKLMRKDKSCNIREYKYEILIYMLIVIGCLVRSEGIDLYPQGLNVDEASSAYEAFSILNYGIDRNGNFLPVFLEAWGSGQNALYTYLMIPFIKLFGLNIVSTRLPMVLISCMSLFIWYKLLVKLKNKKFALIGLAFFVICPWHIMKSRWGLESNIFPDIMLYAIFCIIKFLESKKDRYFYIGFVFLGITAYAYGTSYFFLPLFCIPLLIYLRLKKEIETSKIFSGLAIIGVISFPIILYVLINTFNLPEMKIGSFTIPKLPVNRYEEQTSLFSGNLLISMCNNFINSIGLLVTQNDGLVWNSLPIFGVLYVISLPFILIGLLYDLKEKNQYNNLLKIWFIAAFLLLFVLNYANVNRINILIIPLIYYATVGIYFFTQRSKSFFLAISSIYMILFISFEITYFSIKDNGVVFVKGVEDVIKYVEELDVEDVYIEYAFKEPYIYILYYTGYDARNFIKTVQYFDIKNLGRFDNVKGFGKYNFYIPNELNDVQNVAYIITKDTEYNIDVSDFNIKTFDKYIVLYNN